MDETDIINEIQLWINKHSNIIDKLYEIDQRFLNTHTHIESISEALDIKINKIMNNIKLQRDKDTAIITHEYESKFNDIMSQYDQTIAKIQSDINEEKKLRSTHIKNLQTWTNKHFIREEYYKKPILKHQQEPIDIYNNINHLNELSTINSNKINELSESLLQLQNEFNLRLNSICKTIELLTK